MFQEQYTHILRASRLSIDTVSGASMRKKTSALRFERAFLLTSCVWICLMIHEMVRVCTATRCSVGTRATTRRSSPRLMKAGARALARATPGASDRTESSKYKLNA